MRLHKNKTLFRQVVQFTSDRMQIPAIYIEKDYWVTLALHSIFKNPIGSDTVFKGGTALSKCFKLIDRFSEDIDLVVLRREGESNNKLNAKIKAISDAVNAVLPEVLIEGITHKMGMNRKTAHAYTKEFQGDYNQIRDVIVVEATWLGYHEPYTSRMLHSFVGEMMVKNGQAEIAEENGVFPFKVLVLEPIRTLCEKIMSLVRFSYGEDPMDDLKKKIRHTYDLHQLLLHPEFLEFLNSKAFETMLLKVGNDDVASYKNNNSWLVQHPNKALFFSDLETVWRELKPTYKGNFRRLVYGGFPEDEKILQTMKMIKARLAEIDWNIEL